MAIGYISIATSTQGTAPRTTGNITFSAGDLLVAGAGWEDAGTLNTVSDTVHGGSSGWTIDTLIDGDGARLQVAYKVATSGGTGTATLSFTGGTASFCEAFILNASPPDASPFDKRTVATGSSAAMATGTSADYAQADTLIVGVGKLYNNGNYSGYPTGFTERFDGVGLAVATHNPGATTGLNFTITSTVNDAWAVGQWAFKGATSGDQDITGGSTPVAPSGGAAAVTTQTDVAGASTAVQPTAGAADVSTATPIAGASTAAPVAGGQATVSPGAVGIDAAATPVAPAGGAADVTTQTGVDAAASPQAIAAGAATIDQAGTQNVAGAANQVGVQGGAGVVAPGGVDVAGGSTPVAPTAGAADVQANTDVAAASTAVPVTGGAATATPGAVAVDASSTQVGPTAGAAVVDGGSDPEPEPSGVAGSSSARPVLARPSGRGLAGGSGRGLARRTRRKLH